MPGDLVGRHRLMVVATSGPDSGAVTEGELRLAPALPALRQAAAVVMGTARFHPETVGAVAVGDLGSTDPMRPGVLGFERSAGDSSTILLRLGSESNRQDQQPFEAAYLVLEVTAVGPQSFSGTWRSGVTQTVAAGFFCAVREPSGR